MKNRKSWLLVTLVLAVVLAFAACGEKPATKYDVTVSATVAHGTVSVDKTRAAEGETVTVTATADSGYMLVSGSLKANGVAVNADGTFLMPAEAVEVTAEFILIKYTVSVAEADNGSVSVSPQRAEPGQTVTINITPDSGYDIGSVLVDGLPIVAQNGVWSFTMPEHDATVAVSFTETLYSLTVEQTDKATVTLSTTETELAAGTEVTVAVSDVDEKYEFVQLRVNGSAIAGMTFTMPAEPTTVTVELKQTQGDTFYAGGAWDISKDEGADPSVSFEGTSANQMIWAKESGATIWFETKLNISALNPNDENPTTGIVFRSSDAQRGYYFHLKVLKLETTNDLRIMALNKLDALDGWEWSGMKVDTIGKAYTGEGEYVTLAVAKSGAIVYFYFNGSLVFKGTLPAIDADDELKVGLASLGVATLSYFDYKVVTSDVDTLIGADKVTAAVAPAWTEGTESVGMSGSDSYAGKGVTYYAKKVEGGVKVAAVATHANYVTGFTGGDWWRNTNFELQSGDKQTFFTANTWGADVSGSARAFYTFHDGSLYHTVAEAFIQDDLLVKEDGIVKLGFSWKTQGEMCNNGGDTVGGQPAGVSDWWMPIGHRVNVPAEHYYIHESGISIYKNPTRYNVIVEGDDNANVLVNKTKAHEGEPVTVTVEVTNDLYDLSQILVNGVQSDATFLMPAGDVTVRIVLSEKDNGMFGASAQSATAPTAGWDLTEDKKGNKLLTVDTTGNEYIFLKETASEFWFETKLNITSIKADDGNPTTGLVVKQGNIGAYFYVRALGLTADNEVRIMRSNNVTNFDFAWSGIVVGKAGTYAGEQGEIKLAVAKYGLNEYYFVNDELVYVGAYTELGETVQIGMLSMGVTGYKYYDYSLVKTDAEVKAKLGDKEFTAAAPAWTNGLESVGISGSGSFEGKGVTYYAQKVDGGVKVAAVAHHSTFTANVGNWWENTNFEMFSGGRDSGGMQIWANPRLETGGYMQISRFATVYNEDTKRYTTVVDGFVPTDSLRNVTADGTPRLGFAWKTIGDECNNGRENGGNNADYWVVPGHDIGNVNEQFYVYDNGVSPWASKEAFAIEITGSEYATVTADKETARAGMSVTVTVNITDNNYELSKILVNGVESAGTFTMPAEKATVTVELKEKDYGMFGYSAASPVNPTAGWNLADDKQGTKKVTVSTTGNEYIFLKETPADFWFETKLNITALKEGDGNPTTGIVVKKGANAGGTYFFLRAVGLGDNNEVCIMRSYNVLEYNFGAWHNVIVGHTGKAFSGDGNFITLAVAKLGQNVYYYLNGTLAFMESYPDFGATDACQIGLMSMGVNEYTYYDYSLVNATAEVESKLGADKVTEVALPAWTAGLTSAKLESTGEFEGKDVEFFAQVVEGGVKVAAIAHHALFSVEGDPREWHRTTNFEMFSGSTQYFIAAAPAASGNIKAMSIKTVYDAQTGLYTTVMEGFIAEGQITITDGVARLGFAWKTPGDVGNNGDANGGGNDEYWVPKGHWANNADLQYYITETGVSDTAPAA